MEKQECKLKVKKFLTTASEVFVLKEGESSMKASKLTLSYERLGTKKEIEDADLSCLIEIRRTA
jgi:hypothetical protein